MSTKYLADIINKMEGIEIGLQDREIIQKQKEIYEKLVEGFGIDVAKKVSSDDRFEQLGEADFDMTPFTYGEINFEPIAEILLYLKA